MDVLFNLISGTDPLGRSFLMLVIMAMTMLVIGMAHPAPSPARRPLRDRRWN